MLSRLGSTVSNTLKSHQTDPLQLLAISITKPVNLSLCTLAIQLSSRTYATSCHPVLSDSLSIKLSHQNTSSWSYTDRFRFILPVTCHAFSILSQTNLLMTYTAMQLSFRFQSCSNHIQAQSKQIQTPSFKSQVPPFASHSEPHASAPTTLPLSLSQGILQNPTNTCLDELHINLPVV